MEMNAPAARSGDLNPARFSCKCLQLFVKKTKRCLFYVILLNHIIYIYTSVFVAKRGVSYEKQANVSEDMFCFSKESK